MNGIEEITSFVLGLLFVLGAVLHLISSFGMLRFPDVYSRSHASTKAATLGVLTILTATFLFFWLVLGNVSFSLLLGIAFVFFTAPVGGHLISRAAYRTRVPLWENSVRDELKKKLRPEDYRDAE